MKIWKSLNIKEYKELKNIKYAIDFNNDILKSSNENVYDNLKLMNY